MKSREFKILKQAIWSQIPARDRGPASARLAELRKSQPSLEDAWREFAKEREIDTAAFESMDEPAPPVPVVTLADIERLRQRTTSNGRDMRRDIEWASNYLGVQDVTIDDAPSAGAWTLFLWARSSPESQSAFYKHFVRMLLTSKPKLKEDEPVRRRQRDTRSDQELLEHLQQTLAP